MRACIKISGMKLGEIIDSCNKYFHFCEDRVTFSSRSNIMHLVRNVSQNLRMFQLLDV